MSRCSHECLTAAAKATKRLDTRSCCLEAQCLAGRLRFRFPLIRSGNAIMRRASVDWCMMEWMFHSPICLCTHRVELLPKLKVRLEPGAPARLFFIDVSKHFLPPMAGFG